MKKFFFYFLFVNLIILNCSKLKKSKKKSKPPRQFTAEFYTKELSSSNLEVALSTQTINENTNLSHPTNPTPPTNLDAQLANAGDPNAEFKAYFAGWYYKDKNGTEKKWDFKKNTLSENLKLYPKWSETEYQPKERAREREGENSWGPCFYDDESLYAILFEAEGERKTGNEKIDPRKIDTSKITDMRGLFLNFNNDSENKFFNKEISGWDTSEVTNMNEMFNKAEKFNQPIGSWDTSQVTDMNEMFRLTKAFNQPIGDWNTSQVTNMTRMFDEAEAFNQPLPDWNIGKVTDIAFMFNAAYTFYQNMSQWNWKPSCNIEKIKATSFLGYQYTYYDNGKATYPKAPQFFKDLEIGKSLIPGKTCTAPY